MRDPTVNTKLEAAREEARRLLEPRWRVGTLRGGEDPDAGLHLRTQTWLMTAAPPEDVRQYLYKLISESKSTKKGRRANTYRDRCIATVVKLITEKYDFPPTRNRASRDKAVAESASSIVANVLKELSQAYPERFDGANRVRLTVGARKSKPLNWERIVEHSREQHEHDCLGAGDVWSARTEVRQKIPNK
jgi:hypothetical protein